MVPPEREPGFRQLLFAIQIIIVIIFSITKKVERSALLGWNSYYGEKNKRRPYHIDC